MKTQHQFLHGLSLKIALAAAGVSFFLLLAVYWAYGFFSPAGMLFLAAGMGSVTYGAASFYLKRRLSAAQTMLEHVRRMQFERLDDVRIGQKDELGVLLLQVYRAGRVLEDEIETLKRTENYRRKYIGNVSHELKTPIFAIQGAAETLLRGALEDPDVNHAFVEKILRNVGRLGHLTRDLSEISRIETGDLAMEVESFDVQALLDDVATSLEPVASKKQIALRCQVPKKMHPALGDFKHIRRVLVNLVDNAVKYSNPGSQVEIATRLLPSGEIRFSVVDNGIGIDEEHLPRLTERFYRVDESRSRSQGGTGLGLAIVKHILRAHSRTLQVESDPGRGSTFSFTLPVAR